MKKVLYTHFGGLDGLALTEVARPAVTPATVLVRVKAVSLNPLDWKMWQGEMKLMTGTAFPRGTGLDFSGVVEAVGSAVTRYRPGDEVFGLVDVFKEAALAEYVLVPEAAIAPRPGPLTFAQAAALPVVGLAALQILEQLVSVERGTEVLVNGATGGIGMLVTQLASQRGAIVTAVTGPQGVALARQWGAAEVIDYQQENVRHRGRRYDVVLDLSGKLPFGQARPLMKPQAAFVNTVPGPQEIVGSFLHNLFSRQKYRVLLLKPAADRLARLAQLAGQGLEVLVSARYPLPEFKRAYQQAQQGGVLGKVVIEVS